ncbi:MAG: DUF3105 domain-containing protein, partial [Nocardioidaceae bacterium]
MTLRRAPGLLVVPVAGLLLAACGGVGGGGDGSDADADRGEESPVSGTATGSCADVTAGTASGYDHVDPGTDMDYEGVPPVSGKHWGEWGDLAATSVFSADERPDPGELVHNQEHGWTLVWYDDTVDAAALEEVAAEVADSGVQKISYVPWTEDDGAAFPDDHHVALTHWGYEDDPGEEYRQFCSAPEAASIVAFT